MINKFLIGAYWHKRPLTLRRYADATHAFLTQLRNTHPVFQTLEWVGDRPDSAVKLAPNLSNLDELIFRHAGDNSIREAHDSDRTSSWQSVQGSGFIMVFATEKSIKGGHIAISISAGSVDSRIPDSIVITFPSTDHVLFPHRVFFEYEFLKKLFLRCIEFWKPETGEMTNYAFRDAVSPTDLSYAGWLTYVRDPRAAALRNSASLNGLIFEDAPDGGTLISLGTAMISPDNAEQVENARRLRSILIDEKIIGKT